MSQTFLPAWFTLIGFGWLLGHHWDRVIAWLDRFLDDDDLPPAGSVLHHPAFYGRRHLRIVQRPFDQDADGGDAA